MVREESIQKQTAIPHLSVTNTGNCPADSVADTVSNM